MFIIIKILKIVNKIESISTRICFYVCDVLPVNSDGDVEHELDVLHEPLEPVDPRYGDRLNDR